MTIHTLNISRPMEKGEKFKSVKEWAMREAKDFFNPMYSDRSIETYVNTNRTNIDGAYLSTVSITINYDDKKDVMDVPIPKTSHGYTLSSGVPVRSI